MLLTWAAEAIEWTVGLAWIWRAAETLYHVSEVPDLLDAQYGGDDLDAAALAPALAVIVPALNEQASIRDCLHSLLASEGVRLEIIALNDRSTDSTGAIMDAVAVEARLGHSGHTLRVIHITELPTGWLGKPHALARGGAESSARFVLFTDADAFFAPDALARAMRMMQQADHLVLLPTPILRGPGERMMLGMMQVLAIWPVRLWKIPDADSRDAIGVGCFNLMRRDAYEKVGGFGALRMEVLEDLRIGYLVKHYGLRQRVAFGRGLLRLHWAPGALGIVHGLTKNFFAMCRYRPLEMAGAVCGMAAMTLVPVLGLVLGPAELPSVLVVLVLAGLYLKNAERTGISPGYLLLFPVASCLFLYGMIRSTVFTLAQGGVRWRGSFYPLAELRRNAGPLR